MFNDIGTHVQELNNYGIPFPASFADPFFVAGEGFRYRRISADAPTIIHFHGNGETVANYAGEFAERIAALVANTYFAEFILS